MTSKNLFPELLKENRKRRLWPLALSIVGAIFSLPVFAILSMENWTERLSEGMTTLADIRTAFSSGVAGLGNIPVFLCAVGLAVICGINSMAYLHSKGKTDLYGSLPVKRTDILAAAYVNGLLFFAVPFFIAQVITLILGYVRGMYVLSSIPETLLSGVLVLVFYFSIYTLCCLASVLSGNTLVSVVLSGVMLFMAPLGYLAYYFYASVFFRNFYDNAERMTWQYLSPVLAYVRAASLKMILEPEQTAGFWGDLFLSAALMLAVGIIALILIFALIKKRPAESAGNALSFKWARPLLKVICMIVGTMLIALIFYEVSPTKNPGWMLFGFIVGSVIIHAVIEIVCEFDFKACLRHPLSFIIGAVLSALIILSFMIDAFGYDRYIPRASSVESTALAGYDLQQSITYNDPKDMGYYIGSEEYRLENMKLKCTDDVILLAKKGIEFSDRVHKNTVISRLGRLYDKNDDYMDYNFIVVRYRKKTGGSVYRSYYIDMSDPEVFEAYSRIYETREYKEAVYPVLKAEPEDLGKIRLFEDKLSSDLILDEKDRAKLLRMYRQDMLGFEGKRLKEEIPCAMITSTKPLKNQPYMNEEEYDFVIYPSFEKTLGFLDEIKQRDDLAGGDIVSVDVSVSDPDTESYLTHTYYVSNSGDIKKIDELVSSSIRGDFFREAAIFMDDLRTNDEGCSMEIFFSGNPYEAESYTYSGDYVFPEGSVPEFVFSDMKN